MFSGDARSRLKFIKTTNEDQTKKEKATSIWGALGQGG